MRTKDSMKLSAMLIPAVPCLGYARTGAAPSPPTMVATIDTTKVSSRIGKCECGMFIGQVGPLIYRSLWFEMLDARKFYFPVSSKEPEAQGRRSGHFTVRHDQAA